MKKIFIALVGMAIVMPSVFAATWYVSPGGDDANNGSTWALSKKTIQAGVNAAGGGDTVLVTNGTYVLTNGVTISGIIVKSVNGAASTIAKGNFQSQEITCFYLGNAPGILDGFTVTNGTHSGVEVRAGSTVRNCTISGNTNTASGAGGGVYNQQGTVENCIISGNTASGASGGGGVYNASGCTVTNCTILWNTSSYYGGGVINAGTVENCTILGNTASELGGGVFNYGSGSVKNCKILGNTSSSTYGGGLYNQGTVENCTILGNTASSSFTAGGVYNTGTIRNCIVYYNENYNFSGTAPSYSCVPGLSGNGNISDDPQFIDPGSGYGSSYVTGNYRLKPYSPCINTGTNQTWMTNAVDLAGNARIINSIVDMGAYESTNAVVTRIDPPANVSASDGTFADKVQVTWSEVAGADGYLVYRNADTNVDLLVSFQATHSPYNDTNAIPGSNYYYWVAATNTYGNSLLSNSDRGYRRELDVDLTGVAAVFIDNNYKLYKVLTNGVVTNLCSANYSASHLLRSPQGYVFIGFSSSLRLENDNYYMLVKVNPTNNVVTGIDTSLQNMAWGTLSPSLQLDRDENIYYFANQTDGKLALKKWVNASNIISMINDNISISQWLVNPDGTVLMSGTTTSTGSTWFRKLTPELNLSNFATSIYIYWMLLFPDSRVYTGLSGGSTTNYYGVYQMPSDLSSLRNAALYTTIGPSISRYFKTTDNRMFALTGSAGDYTLTQYYPTPTNCTLTLFDNITLAEAGGDVIVVAGSKDDAYRMILYDPLTGGEVRLLDENIEIYHLQTLSNRTVWFDGLKFSGNRYIIGKIVLAAYEPGVKSFGSAKATYTEIATIAGKPIDFIKIEADPVSTVMETPANVTASDGTYLDKVQIAWSSVNGATGYQVWKNTANDSTSASQIGTLTSTVYDDSNVTANTLYYYWVKAYNSTQTSWFSASDSGYCSTPPAATAPTNVVASDGTYSNKVRVTWNTATVASEYQVWRSTQNNTASASLIGAAVGITYDDENVVSGELYYYWIKSIYLSSVSAFSVGDSGYCGAYPWLPVAADFDGDNKADPAEYEWATGTWLIKQSSSSYNVLTLTGFLGGDSYTALAADFDGDRLADPAVYQAGTWLVKLSSGGYSVLALTGFLGSSGYTALAADFDGDRLADPAVYQAGTWLVKLSSGGYNVVTLTDFLGGSGYTAQAGDFDGDTKADPAIYGESSGYWIVKLSSIGYVEIALMQILGGTGYFPVPADYDGDGLADPAVKSETGNEWILMLSTGGYVPVHITLPFE